MSSDARTTLDAWRARGVDRVNPVRFHFIDALERRTASHSGEARRLLDERLSGLIEGYAIEIARAVSAAGAAVDDAVPAPLAELIDHTSDRRAAASYPELPALDYFRDVWSKVRTEKQLRQSLQPAPGNAGPLNSSSLVHRSLSLMRELSPGYLTQFLSYVDTLAWMEQLNGGAQTSKEASRAANVGKSGRGSKAR
ncbi:DUF2894 domain-containing protein [Paraburkholderia sp. BCC1884]|uniref:DUF2894 domain-containing protein n=1 Tax=Paraburkholderia sp. BCC1884 TaxID=2562668 RepID=UPI0011845231|nr:DUF2894 domain-containing protein [Paraburkholderia sp. BCC1884]